MTMTMTRRREEEEDPECDERALDRVLVAVPNGGNQATELAGQDLPPGGATCGSGPTFIRVPS
jgi:hypothetical protein